VLEGIENNAREARKGLWDDPPPVGSGNVERKSVRSRLYLLVLPTL
jgi:hypothetical protein